MLENLPLCFGLPLEGVLDSPNPGLIAGNDIVLLMFVGIELLDDILLLLLYLLSLPPGSMLAIVPLNQQPIQIVDLLVAQTELFREYLHLQLEVAHLGGQVLVLLLELVLVSFVDVNGVLDCRTQRPMLHVLHLFLRLGDPLEDLLVLLVKHIGVDSLLPRLREDVLLREEVVLEALLLVLWIGVELLSLICSYCCLTPRTMSGPLLLQYISLLNLMFSCFVNSLFLRRICSVFPFCSANSYFTRFSSRFNWMFS
jgi:hypothetical protein